LTTERSLGEKGETDDGGEEGSSAGLEGGGGRSGGRSVARRGVGGVDKHVGDGVGPAVCVGGQETVSR
jgi:hypothetical protein